jgi:predicted GH43/DUF377 family glycosyl hydrolase
MGQRRAGRIIIYAVMAALVISGVGNGVHAAETPSSRLMLSATPEEMARVMQELGLQVEIETHDKGAKRIRARTVTSSFYVNFYTCDERSNCRSIGLTAYFENKTKNAAQFANAWNRDKRFTKVYIDSKNNLRLEYDFQLHHGITAGNVKASIDVFMDHFVELLGALKM